MIKKEGSNYNVYDSSGKKRLGTHKTHQSAIKQLQAIEISKHAGQAGATKPKKKQLGE
jgi:hypothetical protein